MDDLMVIFRNLCDSTADDYFSRFPLIVSELQKISNALLDNIIERELKQTIDFVSQSHFVLAHEYLCYKTSSQTSCEYFALMKEFMRPVVDRMRHMLFAIVESQLFSWIPLLEEPETITNERTRLRKKMKLMHNAYASSAYYGGYARYS